MPCTFTIQLRFDASDDHEQSTPPLSGHYVKVTASNALYEGIAGDANIFLFQREVANPAITDPVTYASYFSAICSPSDMEEVTATTEPAADSATPDKFRLDAVEAYFRSRREAEAFVVAVKEDVALLMHSLKRRCSQLAGPETLTISG
jgi:hypothetical protein